MTHWSTRAACLDADPDDFHPEFHGAVLTHRAYDRGRAICAECPVTAECLAYAMDLEAGPRQFRSGLYGGRTPDERAELARRARVA